MITLNDYTYLENQTKCYAPVSFEVFSISYHLLSSPLFYLGLAIEVSFRDVYLWEHVLIQDEPSYCFSFFFSREAYFRQPFQFSADVFIYKSANLRQFLLSLDTTLSKRVSSYWRESGTDI